MKTSVKEKVDTKQKSLVICIPAYNEEKNIAKLIIDLKKYSDKIIVIDDGSTDYTPKIVSELGVELLQHKVNLGKGAALKTGFARALTYSPDVVVTIDGDGQHEPSFIPKLIEPIIQGKADVVLGARSNSTKMPKYRKMGLNVINFLNRKAINLKIKDAQSGFRAYSGKSINAIAHENFLDYAAEFEQLESLSHKGFQIAEIPVVINYEGLSKTSNKNFISHGGELILASLFMIISRRPIMYLALPGTIFLVGGLFYAFYTLFLFNADRYFSIPMGVLSGVLTILGSLLVLSSMFIYILAKMQLASKYR